MSKFIKRGKVQYYFKGMEMSTEKGIVITEDKKKTKVRIPEKNIDLTFLKIDDDWLLEGHTTSTSLLIGTKFVLN